MSDKIITVDDTLWKKASFPNKIKDDEDIVFIVREDLVVLCAKALGYFGIFFLLAIFRVILAGFADDTGMSLYDAFFYTSNIVLLTAFTMFFHNYYLSMQVVTSDRIIDIDQHGVFKREVNEMPIENIEDVNYKQNGFWGTVFNYGNVIVKSAGSNPVGGEEKAEDQTNGFVFNNVPTPSVIANQLSTLRESNKSNEMREQSQYHAEAMEPKVIYGDKI
jgi:Bacterial PH domain